MDDLEDNSKWLSITGQQARILESIIALCQDKRCAGPKDIIKKESELYKSAPIQRSNFFLQLKKLQEKGYVKKLGDASYAPDFDMIHNSLKEARSGLLAETDKLKGAIDEVEEYYKSQLAPVGELEVTFLSYPKMQDRFASMLMQSKTCYITGLFPKMFYGNSTAFLKLKDTQRYAARLWERCVLNREMHITYLTRLDVDYLFKRMLSVYSDPFLAIDEAERVLKDLKITLSRIENLDVHYTSSPYGIDIGIPDADRLSEFFLFFRNQRKVGVGAIFINSPPMTLKFRDLFREECSDAIDLRSKAGKEVFAQKTEELEAIKNQIG